MVQQAEQNLGAEAFSDLSVKLRDIEEKQSIIKDRVLLIGENLILGKEESDKNIIELKSKISNLEDEVRKIKLTLQMTLDNLNNFVRKNEFDILKRQFEMFSPLELARMSDIEAIIDKKIRQKVRET